nr:unnamed protein product [Spirometra erinaceieuropaei]
MIVRPPLPEQLPYLSPRWASGHCHPDSPVHRLYERFLGFCKPVQGLVSACSEKYSHRPGEQHWQLIADHRRTCFRVAVNFTT